MKEIVRVEQIAKELKKFVADDGTEFETSQACQKYEHEYYRKLLKKQGVETCAAAEDIPNCDGGENYEFHSYYWYRPKSTEELALLRKAFEDEHDGTISRFCDRMIDKWICVETDTADDFVWVTELDDGIQHVKNLLSKFGYELTISKYE